MGLEGKKICIIGGCGHVGLPLGIKLALAGATTRLVDINEKSVEVINGGTVPFVEHGGNEQLGQALAKDLRATTDPKECSDADVVVFVTGTPVDEHLNPKIADVLKVFDDYKEYFKPDSLVVMRSTLYPGTMDHLYEKVEREQIPIRLSFCPERVAEGYALDEIESLPQIVSANNDESFQTAADLWKELAPSVIRLEPLEAELTKLMANSWRYLEFAIANQFYMIAESQGVDFFKIYGAIQHDYPRASGYKRPGFAAGPCLFKDTMQLASFFDNKFYLGHSAMLVNEGLATFAVDKASKEVGGSLWGKKVGLLGMTFKANNDDTRESLSFKVKKGLEFGGAEVLWHDPYLEGSTPIVDVMQQSDVIILCTPHKEYHDLSFGQPIVDVWGLFRKPELEIQPGRKSA